MEELIEETRLLTESEVARRLLISRRHLQRLCRTGEIQFVAVSPRVRGFRPEHIEDYIRRKTVIPPKFVDTPRSERLPFPRKGGDNRNCGDSFDKAQIRKELRSWR